MALKKCVICGDIRGTDYTPFEFPKDEDRRRAWIDFCNPQPHAMTKKIYHLCSKHFTEDSFIKSNSSPYMRKRLKNTAIPSLYSASDSIQNLCIPEEVSNPDAMEKTNDDKLYSVIFTIDTHDEIEERKDDNPVQCKRTPHIKRCCMCKFTEGQGDHTYFPFPRKFSIRVAWATFCGIAEISVKPEDRLCERHFKEKDFQYRAPDGTSLKLKPSAIPSIYTTISNAGTLGLENIVIPTLSGSTLPESISSSASGNSSSFTIPQNTINVIPVLPHDHNYTVYPSGDSSTGSCPSRSQIEEPRYPGDVRIEHFQSPRSATRCLTLVNNALQKKSKTIKYLRTQNRRLMQKVKSLEETIIDMQEKRYFAENDTN